MINYRFNCFTKLILIIFISTPLLTACASAAPTMVPARQPKATPTVMRMNMEPIVKSYLANMPDNWGYATSILVANQKPFIVDVRLPEQYARGFIAGSFNIPLRTLARNLDALPGLDTEIVLVSDRGIESAVGMTILQLLGYKKAKSLFNGLEGWTQAKLTLTTQPVPALTRGPKPAVDATLLAVLDDYLNTYLPNNYGIVDLPMLKTEMSRRVLDYARDLPTSYEPGPPVIIDVSEPDEFAKGSIPGAINIPMRTVPQNLEMIPWEKPWVDQCGAVQLEMDRTYAPIVVVCANGHRSAIIMTVLQLLNFNSVEVLDGGLKTWNAGK
jgi:rhodanese-related sulfurtransferase